MTKIKLSKTPWIPNGFIIESNEVITSFDPEILSLHLEPEQKENSINGEQLAERMKGKGLNSTVLRYLLDNPELIPEAWKEKTNGYTTWIYFWGTILRVPDGDRCVLCLYCHDGGWFWYYCRLVGAWSVYDPSAIASKSLSTKNVGTSDTLNSDLSREKKQLKEYLDVAEEAITKAKKLLQ